ncbi:retroviral-like aspartic protease family protein [Sandaracinus amylolyticus]|uniref:retroviral-like aspartic protease family protein n=1 Tax=Sandaracinus amylolyticus TaxID=927083 RepID=UPI001F17D609|nr:retroviral-like aspartic protease family protein [Sandaracinus amylolyticus]UJR78737.1 Hypothetical protein I5071_7680 [Sandaracinus amylolyticus]
MDADDPGPALGLDSRAVRRLAVLSWWICLVACGGATARTSDTRAIDDAVRAYRAGDLETALARSEEARATLPGDPLPREIAARAGLALGRPAVALIATEGAHEEPLVRLRAAAFLAGDDYDAAARALGALDDDPWASAIAAIAAIARGRTLHAREGAASSTLALREDTALPVIAIHVEGRATLALIATSVHLTVLAPSLRAEHGVADEIALGAMRVRDVPFVVRDLDAESAALGVELGAVIGLDLLARVGARIEQGSQSTLGVPAARDGIAHATFEGTILVAHVEIDGRTAHLLVDSAGAYALAITPSGAERIGLDAETATVRLGDVAITDVPIARDVMDDSLEAHVESAIDGALGWALLASLVVELGPGHLAISAE